MCNHDNPKAAYRLGLKYLCWHEKKPFHARTKENKCKYSFKQTKSLHDCDPWLYHNQTHSAKWTISNKPNNLQPRLSLTVSLNAKEKSCCNYFLASLTKQQNHPFERKGDHAIPTIPCSSNRHHTMWVFLIDSVWSAHLHNVWTQNNIVKNQHQISVHALIDCN